MNMFISQISYSTKFIPIRIKKVNSLFRFWYALHEITSVHMQRLYADERVLHIAQNLKLKWI